MNFAEAMHAMKEGSPVRRICWKDPAAYCTIKNRLVRIHAQDIEIELDAEDLMANDWAQCNTPDYEIEYGRFFKAIVENDDGTLNKDAVMRELADYSVFMGEVSKVYYTLTNGLFSKPNYKAEAILDKIQEIAEQECQDFLKENCIVEGGCLYQAKPN